MEKTVIKKNRILVGITARTNNTNEMNQDKSKIGPIYQEYFSKNIANQIPYRTAPGTTYSAYTNFESDHTGDYTYFLGEEVSSLDNLPEGLSSITVPAGTYIKFTTPEGPIITGVIATWQKIWSLENNLGARKRYVTDFEIHDKRAKNPEHGIVDIYIGVEE